jgi:hypothetical protein
MCRCVPLLLLALLPVAVAAPIPPGGRAEFGASGLLTRADLERVVFKSHPVKPGENVGVAPIDEDQPGKFDVAVHMPWTKLREGEPIPAYFVLKNLENTILGLDAQLELFRPRPTTQNACRISIRGQSPVTLVRGLTEGAWHCSNGALVQVPANGFYVVRGELTEMVEKGLPPGEYEVDWQYGKLRSSPVPFTVVKAEAKPVTREKHPNIGFYRLVNRSRHETDTENAGEPHKWQHTELTNAYTSGMAAALAVGQTGVYVPDLHNIPSADKYVEAQIEWKTYREGDRLAVTLRAVPPYKEVQFADVPQLYLQVNVHDGYPEWLKDNVEDEKEFPSRTLVTPVTIETRLPANWRERLKVADTVRVAVLVTSKRLQLTERAGNKHDKTQKVEDNYSGKESPPVWYGTLRTKFVELQFPPLPPNPQDVLRTFDGDQ